MTSRKLYSACMVAIASMAGGAISTAYAQATYSIDQPQQSMADAIRAVGITTGTSILFDPALVAGRTALSVRGQLSAEAALTRLLVGTGLIVRKSGENALIIERGNSSTSNTGEPANYGASTDPELTEIIVTGTRLQTLGYQAPTPTRVIGSEHFEDRAAVKITDALLDIPAFSNGQQVPGFSSSGSDYIDLRGLNGRAARSLVLVNGQRMVATNAAGQTDISVIPTALIQRTDVVTGGASAAWGSDALAGVVNVVLRKSLNGLQANLQYGQTRYNDNKQVQGALAYGSSFSGERGHFMVAGEYNQQTDPPTYADRDWGRTNSAYTTQTIDGVRYTNVATDNLTLQNFTAGGVLTNVSTANNLLITVPNPPSPYYSISSSTPNKGNVNSSATIPFPNLRGIQFGPNGTPLPYNNGATNLPNGGTGGAFGRGEGLWLADKGQINGKTSRFNLYGVANYNLTDNIELTTQLGWSRSELEGLLQVSTLGNSVAAVVGVNNPYLQALTGNVGTTGQTLPQLLAANNVTAVAVTRYTPEFGRPQTNAVNNVYRAAVSVDGKFRDQGKWTTFAHYGKSDYLATFKNVIVQANLRAALESINVGGQIVCNPTIVALYGADPGCQPLNPFGVGSITPAAANYIAGRPMQQNIVNTMKAVGANFGDEPFSTWAGPASIAAGVDWREISLQTTNDRVMNLPVNGVLSGTYLPQGFNYVTGTSGADSGNAKDIAPHSQSITEEFAEINLPLLKVDEFKADLNAAYRLEQNSFSGETKNWKLGGIIQVFKGFTLRAAKSLDSRDPNLSELYTGNNSANGTINAGNPDPGCPVAVGSPCQATYNYTNISTRTPDLKPEVGHSTSIGFTLNPEWLYGISMGVDFWKIVIDGQIANTNNVVNACYGNGGTIYANNPQPDLCSNIVRANGPGTPIAFVYNPTFNNAKATQAGVDYDFHYRARLDDFASWLSGNFNFDAVATHIRTNTSQPRGVAPTDNNGLPGNPNWRMTFQQTYANGPWRFSLVEKMVGSQSFILNNGAVNGAVPYYNNKIPTVWYINAQAAYTVFRHETSNLQVYANVKNLTNVDPPLILGAGNFPTPTNVVNNYDVSGQTWTLGVRYRQ